MASVERERGVNFTARRVWDTVGLVSAILSIASFVATRMWPESLWPWYLLGLTGEAIGFSVVGGWLERRRLEQQARSRSGAADVSTPSPGDS